MPAPLAIAAGIAAVIGAIDASLSLYERTQPDPLQDDIDLANDRLRALSDDLDGLQSSLNDLGDDLMAEFKVTQDLIPTVAINEAIADAKAARAQLQRLERTETPSGVQKRDAVNRAESALLGVLEQAEPKLRGGDPVSALGFAASLAFAAGVRMQAAWQVEDGAIGARTTADGLQRTAAALRQIEEAVIPQLEDHMEVASEVAGTWHDTVHRYASIEISVTSEATDRTDYEYEVAKVPFSYVLLPDWEVFRAAIETKRAPGMIEEQAQADYEELGFAELIASAEGLEALSDGADIVGNRRGNTLEGTDGNDLVSGLGGDDRLFGGRDADVMYGGSGADLLKGQAGNDALFGQGGRDRLLGGGGDDGLHGGRGRDVARGGGGDDVLGGGNGRDKLFGGRGADDLHGGRGSDVLKGGRGADAFVFDTNPKRGTDVIRDFRGDDVIALENDVFRGLREGDGLRGWQFQDDGTPNRKKATILYEDGVLSYDRDGTGRREAVAFAELRGDPELTADDFVIL